jgi:hypothetical protein
MGCRPGKAELNTVKTLIKFPNVVFREWGAKSRGYFVSLNSEEYQVFAEEEALHSWLSPQRIVRASLEGRQHCETVDNDTYPERWDS